MRREWAAISSVKTGSTFSSSATSQGRRAQRRARDQQRVADEAPPPHREQRLPLRIARDRRGDDVDDRLAVVVGAQDPRDPAPGLAVARRQREVEVVEHARR